MRTHIWGTDFRRTSGENRRGLFIAPEERAQFLKSLLADGFEDVVYLATCNRIEFFTTAADPFSDTRALWMKLLKRLNLPEELYFQGYHLEGKAAARHLLRVAGSLESLVVGEPQILGQLKDALQFSVDNEIPVHASLHRLFQTVFETAKKIRTETSIAEKSVSIATLGIRHLQKREREFPLEKVVVVGRSPINRVVLQWLIEKRPQTEILWVNRNLENLSSFDLSRQVKTGSLAEFLQNPTPFSHLITATSSREPLFGPAFFAKLPEGRRLVFDFAEPMDVVDSHLYPGIELVELEDLQEEAARNADDRKTGVAEAELIIDAALRAFCLQQKEAPLLKDFNGVEPSFQQSFQAAWEVIQNELPADCHPKVRKWAENLVKKNLHLSREHLKLVLRKVTDPYEDLPFVS